MVQCNCIGQCFLALTCLNLFSNCSTRVDLIASAGSNKNKNVKYGIIDDNCDGAEVDICPDLLIAGLALFGAGAFAALYMAITMAASKKRRKRSLGQPVSPEGLIGDLLLLGISFLLSFSLDLLSNHPMVYVTKKKDFAHASSNWQKCLPMNSVHHSPAAVPQASEL